MKHTQGKWFVKQPIEEHRQIFNVFHKGKKRDLMVASCGQSEANATLIASSPELLQLLKDILAEVRPEISRVNSDAGCTIFNPVATETIDMAKDLIAKAEGK